VVPYLIYTEYFRQNIIESGGIKVLLAAVINHLSSHSSVKMRAALWLCVKENKESVNCVSLGGATAIAKVRKGVAG
jgi:hypothetical protein